eukprot:12529250-Prorocentrum_lima.AAC.1
MTSSLVGSEMCIRDRSKGSSCQILNGLLLLVSPGLAASLGDVEGEIAWCRSRFLLRRMSRSGMKMRRRRSRS